MPAFIKRQAEIIVIQLHSKSLTTTNSPIFTTSPVNTGRGNGCNKLNFPWGAKGLNSLNNQGISPFPGPAVRKRPLYKMPVLQMREIMTKTSFLKPILWGMTI
jgi:hypothetical protein